MPIKASRTTPHLTQEQLSTVIDSKEELLKVLNAASVVVTLSNFTCISDPDILFFVEIAKQEIFILLDEFPDINIIGYVTPQGWLLVM